MYEEKARKAIDFASEMIDTEGPRLAGSEACGRAAQKILEKAAMVSDRAAIETFPVHPAAFLDFIKVLVVFYALAALGLAVAPVLSVALSTLSLIILVFGFLLYKEVLDPFFPKLEGRNVVGVLEPSGEVKRQVIVSGHHDSARIFNFYVDRPELYSRRIYGGIGSVVAIWLVSIVVALVSGLALGTPFWGFDLFRWIAALIFIAVFPIVLTLWKFAADEGTPGAGDNLVASTIALEILKEFNSRRDAGEGLIHTRLVFASFDAEEAGLRGARAFARGRKAEFAALPSYGYNMDCVYSLPDLRILTSDLNGSVKLDEGASASLARIAAAEGLPSTTQPIAFLTGGTDAAELASAGVHATSLLAMKWGNDARSSAYHTLRDTIDSVDPAAVEAFIRLGLRFVESLDSENA
ncbi:MAG: M28 family peptidase [Spirochaetes bacterium]|nr:M28 family peptidase [Spirochaetota bacterium]